MAARGAIAHTSGRGARLSVRTWGRDGQDSPKNGVSAVEVLPRAQVVAEVQRARLLAAAVGVVAELGYVEGSVGHITARARVSRRTFYELFANREECMVAVLRDAAERVRSELEASGVGGLGWHERLRTGLRAMLSFLDREPVLARVCVVEMARGGPDVLRLREELLGSLAGVLDEQRGDRAGCTPLTAHGLIGAALAIVHAHLLAEDQRPLVGLQGELMAILVLPYLGAKAAQRELERPPSRASSRSAAGKRHALADRAAAASGRDPLAGLSVRLTYRTLRVLSAIGAEPGASNRRVAQLADIGDPGQISRLLARLQRLGLVRNTGPGRARGEANVWRLTASGEEVQTAFTTTPASSGTRAARSGSRAAGAAQ
jgi:AcrR family transcriptional regulator